MRVLVADDETGIRELIVELLDEQGFEVLGAIDGIDAINLIRTKAGFDLLVTDIDMPGADGFDVAREARSCLPGVGIIFISGRYHQKDKKAEIGNSVFLHKPFTMRLLLDTVHAELSQ